MAQLVSAPPCHGGGRGFKSRQGRSVTSVASGAVAQLVERPPEKWKVTSSILVRATTKTPTAFEQLGFFILCFYIAGLQAPQLVHTRA